MSTDCSVMEVSKKAVANRAHTGFTLIEVLVVMVVLGIASMMVAVNFARDNSAVLRDQGGQLAIDLEAAFDLSRHSGQAVAIIVDSPETYHFLMQAGDGRLHPAAGSLNGTRRFTAAFFESVEVSGEVVRFGTPIILRSGRSMRLEIVLGLNERRVVVSLSPTGNAVVM